MLAQALLLSTIHRNTSTLRAQKFPEVMFFRINSSGLNSETRRFSLAFSDSKEGICRCMFRRHGNSTNSGG
jgi:hypothetical protein